MFLTFKSPIPEAIKDPAKISSLFEKYNIIPYYGNNNTTSQTLLHVLADLADMSPSHTACKRDLKAYAFGGTLDVKKFGIPGLSLSDEESKVDPDTKLNFFKYVLSIGLSPAGLLNVTKEIFDLLKDGGNAYLHIKKITIGNTFKYTITPWHFTQVCYLAKGNPNENQYAIITAYWDEEYWRIKPPLTLPVSFLGEEYVWQETGAITETLLHIKNENTRTQIYGKSDLLSVLNALYAEYKTLELNAKISGTELTAKHLLAFEEPDPGRVGRHSTEQKSATSPKNKKNDFQMRIQALRELVTNEGTERVTGLAGIQYPKGGQPPKLIDFNVNRDVEYARWTTDNATSLIFSVNGWAKELTGQVSIKAGVGANMLYDLFLVKNVSTVKPLQDYYGGTIWADIFSNLGLDNKFSGLTIAYPDLITQMINSFRNASSPIEQGNNPIQRDNDQLSNV